MTDTVLCNKCGKPVSLNLTFNTANIAATTPSPNPQNWVISNNTGAVSSSYKMDFTATSAAANPPTNFISTDQMCQCGGS